MNKTGFSLREQRECQEKNVSSMAVQRRSHLQPLDFLLFCSVVKLSGQKKARKKGPQ